MPRIALFAAASLALCSCLIFRSRTPKATGAYKVVVYSNDEKAEPLARAFQFEALAAQRTLLEHGKQPPFEVLPYVEGPGVAQVEGGPVGGMPAGSSVKELQELCARLGADLLVRADLVKLRDGSSPDLLLYRPERMDLLASVNEDGNRGAAAQKAVEAVVKAANGLLREDGRAGEVVADEDLRAPEPGSAPPPALAQPPPPADPVDATGSPAQAATGSPAQTAPPKPRPVEPPAPAEVKARAAPAPASPVAGRMLAVLELDSKLAGRDREALQRSYFSDLVRRQALKHVSGLRVVSRENIELIARANGVDLEKCEGLCAVETGRKLGADLVISGALLRVGSFYKLTLELHDTGSGDLLSTGEASGKSADALLGQAAGAIDELLAPLQRK